MRTWGVVLVVSWLVVCGSACGGRVPPRPPPIIVLGLPLEAFQIQNNGLRVVLVPDPQATKVYVGMHYRVGAADDPAGREGMAHLVEHVMFEQRVGSQTVMQKLEATAEWQNAATGYETTSYVSRGDPDRLADLLQIEALRLGIGCKTLSEEAFVRERDIVRNEIRERADPVGDELRTAIFPAPHPYHRPLGGTEASVGRITRDEVCAFIASHYSPDNAVLTVSGAVTTEALDAALAKLLGRVAKHAIASRAIIPPMVPRGRHDSEVGAEEAFAVLAWPLPSDPATRAAVRAVAQLMQNHVNARVAGSFSLGELDGTSASLTFTLRPATGQDLKAALEEAQLAAIAMQVWFRPMTFERARERTFYHLFAGFEDPVSRDLRLAQTVHAGADPRQTLATEMHTLHQLTAAQAQQLANEYLSFERATLVTFQEAAPLAQEATGSAAGPAPTDAAPSVHAPGELRTTADPAEAHTPARRTSERKPYAARTRTLGNGLRVVFLPTASVPTVDIRLVFGAGTAADGEGSIGVAFLAASTLRPSVEDGGDLEAMLRAYLSGSALGGTAGPDHTTFAVRGLAMHIDVLLTWLERTIRSGQSAKLEETPPKEPTTRDHQREEIGRRWLSALYGAGHPYTRPPIDSRTAASLRDKGLLRKFREAHYRPGSATLIVAGGFDPEIADAWIDYLFADWDGGGGGGGSAAVTVPMGKLRPVSLAWHEESAKQVGIGIALPAVGGRAASLIAAEMLDAAVAGVRTELGASYGIDAALVERRRAAYLQISGLASVERAAEALALIRDRIGRLSAGDEAAAALFVAARRKVVAALESEVTGASALARRAEESIARGAAADEDLATAEAVRAMTLRGMVETLRALDLAAAAILMTGPRDAVSRAYAVIGRTPEPTSAAENPQRPGWKP